MSFNFEARLLLIRHGQTPSNVDGLFTGRKDESLTELGHKQARSLIKLVAGEKIHHIYASRLKRAQETAAPLSEHKQLEVELDVRLNEMDYGAWEGMSYAQARDTHPHDFAAWLGDGLHHGPTDGECLQDVLDRAAHFVRDLDLSGGRTYAIVSHGGLLQAMLCHIMGLPTRAIWPFRLANGSLSEVQFTNGCPVLTRLSLT